MPLAPKLRTSRRAVLGVGAVALTAGAAQAGAAGGELGVILRAGYAPALGAFGAHRYHHARTDDLRCVSPALIPPVARAFARTIWEAVASG